MEAWTNRLGENEAHGIANNSEGREPAETSEPTSLHRISSKVRKARCNIPRNRQNGGKKGNSSALASTLTEYEETQKIDDCGVPKNRGSLDDNNREVIVTSSSINEGVHNVFTDPTESFEPSCLEQASEGGNNKGDEEVISKIANATIAVSKTSSAEKSSKGKLTLEAEVKPVDDAQPFLAPAKCENTLGANADILSVDYLLIVLFDHSVKKNTSAHSLNFEAFYLTS